MNEVKDLNYLFNEMPIYTKEKFEVFKLKDNKYELNESELDNFYTLIGVGQSRLISKCHKCKKEFPFLKDKSLFEFGNGYKNTVDVLEIVSKEANGGSSFCGYIRFGNKTINGVQPPYPKERLLNNKIWYLEYYFTCTNDNSHNYIMLVSIELKDGAFTVRKVGQNPSMLTVKGFDFDKYKKILESLNAYDDYKKADLSNAEQFYVGAYAYLRRIFEKMITYYLGDKKLKDNHMETKIEAVNSEFDPRIRNLLKNLYGILSISIHELNEEQSKEYYVYLKTIIDMQLEYMQTEADKEKQTKSLSDVINKITSGIKNIQ